MLVFPEEAFVVYEVYKLNRCDDLVLRTADLPNCFTFYNQ